MKRQERRERLLFSGDSAWNREFLRPTPVKRAKIIRRFET